MLNIGRHLSTSKATRLWAADALSIVNTLLFTRNPRGAAPRPSTAPLTLDELRTGRRAPPRRAAGPTPRCRSIPARLIGEYASSFSRSPRRRRSGAHEHVGNLYNSTRVAMSGEGEQAASRDRRPPDASADAGTDQAYRAA